METNQRLSSVSIEQGTEAHKIREQLQFRSASIGLQVLALENASKGKKSRNIKNHRKNIDDAA